MRWIFFASLLLCVPVFASGQVLINEIYYDHSGRDDGYEFLELVNTAGQSVDLGGWTIDFHDGASTGWVTIWRAGPGLSIRADGLLTIGGEFVAPVPDIRAELGLQNGPDAVRLTRFGDVVDLVGYGDLEGAGYFETAPARDVDSGESLARRIDGVDTDDNSVDFDASIPSPGAFNRPRHDLELASAGTPVIDILDVGSGEILAFNIINRGIREAVATDGSVVLRDSTGVGFVDERSVAIPLPIEPGGRVRVEFDMSLAPGDHWLAGHIVWPLDERPRNNTIMLARRVGPSPVVVSEVMCDPRAACPEYVELYNSGLSGIDLGGAMIRDAAHSFALITARAIEIFPFACVVLTPDADALRVCFPRLDKDDVVEIEGTWPSLNATGSGSVADSVIVTDMRGLPLDRIAYPPQPSGTKGTSLERVDVFPCRGPHAWSLSRAPGGGSPGFIPEGSLTERPVGTAINATPNPFDPFSGEHVTLTVPAARAGSHVVAGVFDLDGRRIADVGSASAFPAVFVWDGRDADGRMVVVGLYILICEFYSNAGYSRRVEKVVVGCARKKR